VKAASRLGAAGIANFRVIHQPDEPAERASPEPVSRRFQRMKKQSPIRLHLLRHPGPHDRCRRPAFNIYFVWIESVDSIFRGRTGGSIKLACILILTIRDNDRQETRAADPLV
jgi:hypothetical protein